MLKLNIVFSKWKRILALQNTLMEKKKMYGVSKLWQDLRSIKKELARTQKRDLFVMETLKAELQVMEDNIQGDVEYYRQKLSKIISERRFFYQKRASNVRNKMEELMAIRHEVLKLKERIGKSL